MGKKISEITGGIEQVYDAVANNKKFRLHGEIINPDIKRVIVSKLGIPICANVRIRISKSKI